MWRASCTTWLTAIFTLTVALVSHGGLYAAPQSPIPAGGGYTTHWKGPASAGPFLASSKIYRSSTALR
jgi:hypothetical protein